MPAQVSYPGVYIQEISSGSRTITGVSTSVALFIGMAEQGPMDKPVKVLSVADFYRTFGAENKHGELHDQVAQFFLNGGSTAYVMRIADETAAAAQVRLKTQAEANALTLIARSKGVIGNNLRAIVDYNTSSPESTFNLRLESWSVDSGGNPIVAASETFKDLSMDPNHGKYAINVLDQNSALVTAIDHAAGTTFDGYTLWGLMESFGSTANIDAALPGKFMVSVDDGPYVLASLAANTTVAIKNAIDTALSAQGKTVTVTKVDLGTAYTVYQIEVDGGRRIRFARATEDDMAAAMHMTSDLGALEVDGYALRRPAPNGYFSALQPNGWAATLGVFAEAALAGGDFVNPLTFTDSVGNVAFSPTWAAATGTMAAPGGAEPSLRGIQQNLDALVTAINAEATISTRWTAARHGHRLVMTAKFNGDTGSTATLVADPGTDFDPYFADAANVTRYKLGTGSSTYQDAAILGNDGGKPTAPHYALAYPIIEREVDLFNILVLPRAEGQGDEDRLALWGPASAFAKKRRAFLLVDPPSAWSTSSDVETGIANLRIGVATDHAAVYWPPVTISARTGLKAIDPAGSIAGVMARTDSARGVWKAPAGLEANLLGVRGVKHPMSDAENGLINPQAANAVRSFPQGIVSWGARTMVGFDNSGNDDYKYVPVRRFALYIEESLYRGLKWAVFEPNDEPLWRQIRQAAGGFMNNLFRLGAFAGSKSSDAYFVSCGPDTTTQNDINLGIVNVVIGFAPLKPAEFVVVTLQQKAGEVQT